VRTHNYVDGKTYEVHLSEESSASSYGQPVVVTADGEAIDRFSWEFHGMLEATAEEVMEFEACGYPCRPTEPRPGEEPAVTLGIPAAPPGLFEQAAEEERRGQEGEAR